MEAPMANLITTLRLALLCLLVWLGYEASPQLQLLNAPLVLLIFILDGVDGYVARRRGEASLFGSVYDIAADRIVENALWLQLADLDLVPVWVALLFIVRGILVDSIRGLGTSRGLQPFGLTASALGHFLVAGRFMRAAYGTVKAVTFGWIFLLQPWPALIPHFWFQWAPMLNSVTALLIWLAVTLCLLRAMPVLLTVLPRTGRTALRRADA
jgi:CDP-diacylglycerol--glycerol-3-phosphate 3-phosphatidyltransferase